LAKQKAKSEQPDQDLGVKLLVLYRWKELSVPMQEADGVNPLESNSTWV
jgi:hypothetical protein